MTTIAAVIPTYNAAAFLEDTLASVFAQTRKPDEVIVVDDASTDNTAEIARRMGAQIIVLQVNSGGPALPLNTGIAAATSEWIATLDHDDRWMPDWLESSAAAQSQAQAELLFGRVQVMPRNSEFQKELDANFDEIKTLGIQNGARAYDLPNETAIYNRLVSHLSLAVTCSNIIFMKNVCLYPPFDPKVSRCCDYRFLQKTIPVSSLAFVDSYSCQWVGCNSSLYQRGDIDRLDRDLMYVYKMFDREWLSLEAQTLLSRKCRKTALDLAYAARQRGEYRRAFADYCDSIRYGNLNFKAFAGIAKLPFAMLRGPRA